VLPISYANLPVQAMNSLVVKPPTPPPRLLEAMSTSTIRTPPHLVCGANSCITSELRIMERCTWLMPMIQTMTVQSEPGTAHCSRGWICDMNCQDTATLHRATSNSSVDFHHDMVAHQAPVTNPSIRCWYRNGKRS